MADADPFSDEYVAGLLAKDAEESATKYSALGMGAFSPPKPSTHKPKPNIRFLRTIIKETDSHNAALLAKEASESKARLANLVTKDARAEADIRRRQLGHITAHLTGRSSKRRRTEAEARESSVNTLQRNTSVEPDKSSRKSEATWRRGERYYDDYKDLRYGTENGFSRRHSHGRRRSRSVECSEISDKRRERRLHRRSRSRSPREHHGRELKHRKRSRDRKSPSRFEGEDSKRYNKSKGRRGSPDHLDDGLIGGRKLENEQPSKRKRSLTDDSSDPLDDIIGPRPPPTSKVRSRGRGTVSAASGIDTRFSSDYDPTIDVQFELDEENDWDQALEAIRDRQKWKQQGADRLRAAGFTEEEIGKWEKGGKKEEDVKWTKKGESREWDRGKVAENNDSNRAESIIKADLNWGRLRGT